MFAEFEAEAYRVLVAETPERNFRREYYESRKSAAPAKKEAPYRRTDPVSVREAALLKVARFIRLA